MLEELKFAELISARYSHDLAGPIGALNSGVEFLEDDDESMKRRAVDLIKSSAEQAVIRLQFYRQVYGYLKEDTELSLGDIISLGDLFFSLTKIKLTWEYHQNDESLSQFKSRFAKLILNFLNLSALMLVTAGEVTVKFISNKKFIVEIKGDKIILDDYLIAVIKGEVAMVDISSKNIHIYYLTRLLKEAGAVVEVRQQDKLVTITVQKK